MHSADGFDYSLLIVLTMFKHNETVAGQNTVNPQKIATKGFSTDFGRF